MIPKLCRHGTFPGECRPCWAEADSNGHAPVDDGHDDHPAGLAEILDRSERFVRRFCVLPDEHAYPTVALWVAHAHAMGAWDSTPRLAPVSPEPGSGKTRLLEVIATLVPNPVDAVNCTPAALFRKIGESPAPTVLHDEVDTVFGTRKQAENNEDIRGLLNAGHRRSGKALRCVGQGTQQTVVEFPAYAAVALAGLGRLPDTILSRAIVLRMRRRAPTETVESWRAREHEPAGHELRAELTATLHEAAIEALAVARPPMPAGVIDRSADKWEPLLAVADLAGGDWPQRARAAASWFCDPSRDAEPASLGLRLLGDLRAVWLDAGDPLALTTAEIIERLRKVDEAPWDDLHGRPLDPRRLGKLLRDYEVRSREVRSSSGGKGKGYHRDQLADPWARYLVPAGGDKGDIGDSPWSDADPMSPHGDRKGDKGDTKATPDDPLTSRVADVADVAPIRHKAEGPPCARCGTPLGALDIAEGHTTHASCEGPR